MSHAIPSQVSFEHVVLEGTAYEVGRAQAEKLRNDPVRLNYLTPTLPFLDRFSSSQAEDELAYIERYCPAITDEVRGAADALGVEIADIAFLGGTPKDSGCSQFAVLPTATSSGHTLVGQTMDSTPGDLDLRLCTTRVRGKAAHIGFSDMVMGRTQGLNEHGLCVTTTWGAPGVWPEVKGLAYFAAVRALLDRCESTEHAVDVLASLPIQWCTNFVLSDRSGQVALVEVSGAHRGIRWVAPEDGYVSATNHYGLTEMRPYDVSRRRESVARQRTIDAFLGEGAPEVDVETIRALLSHTMPDGVCQHYYSSGLGTLWCSITDVTEGTIEVCFGAPSSERNPWHAFGLSGPTAPQTYAADLPDEPAPVGFWERLPADGAP
jgi:predicted choloylglycine hydrolase